MKKVSKDKLLEEASHRMTKPKAISLEGLFQKPEIVLTSIESENLKDSKKVSEFSRKRELKKKLISLEKSVYLRLETFILDKKKEGGVVNATSIIEKALVEFLEKEGY